MCCLSSSFVIVFGVEPSVGSFCPQSLMNVHQRGRSDARPLATRCVPRLHPSSLLSASPLYGALHNLTFRQLCLERVGLLT